MLLLGYGINHALEVRHTSSSYLSTRTRDPAYGSHTEVYDARKGANQLILTICNLDGECEGVGVSAPESDRTDSRPDPSTEWRRKASSQDQDHDHGGWCLISLHRHGRVKMIARTTFSQTKTPEGRLERQRQRCSVISAARAAIMPKQRCAQRELRSSATRWRIRTAPDYLPDHVSKHRRHLQVRRSPGFFLGVSSLGTRRNGCH